MATDGRGPSATRLSTFRCCPRRARHRATPITRFELQRTIREPPIDSRLLSRENSVMSGTEPMSRLNWCMVESFVSKGNEMLPWKTPRRPALTLRRLL